MENKLFKLMYFACYHVKTTNTSNYVEYQTLSLLLFAYCYLQMYNNQNTLQGKICLLFCMMLYGLYRTVYKTPLGMSPYIFVYGNACHFPIELEYKVMWAMKKLNLNLGKSSRHRMLPLLELEEFRIEAYESAQIYKSKVKKRLDARIQNREFKLGEKVLLFDSRLKLFPRKLKS